MNIKTRLFGAIVILGGLAGCAGEEGTPSPTAAEPSPGQSPSKRLGGPMAKKGDEPAAKPGDAKTEAPSAAPTAAPAPKGNEAPKIEGPSKTDTSKPAASAVKLSAKELAGIKELPQAEQDAALAQAVCPVSTHHLGSMGKPLKVTAEGRTFYICCDGCEEDVKTKGKEIVAKLDKQKAGD
jgi:hypothetical protein